MNTTQDHIPIEEIKDKIVLLKDGGAVVILQTSAVNFGLLSQEEQMATIFSFAQMLNSLSFAIQIVIRSKRLDISSYLHLLDVAIKSQTNPLLAQNMLHYRQFVQSLIKENEVLDKKFYIVVPYSYLEMGIRRGAVSDRLTKAKTALEPRSEQIIRQLNRVGLKTNRLDTKDLVELFFDIYNPSQDSVVLPVLQSVSLNQNPSQSQPIQQITPLVTPPSQPAPVPPRQPQIQPQPQSVRNHPFVVEELTDSV